MNFKFDEANEQKFQELIPRYPQQKSLVLPALWMIQYQEGYISSRAMAYLAKRLNLPTAHLYGVATFYTMFNLEPVAPFHIQVCKTLSCELCGKAEIIKVIEEETGLKVNESNEFFKLSEVECLGACGGAPMLAMNEEYHENLTPTSTRALLKRCLK